MQLAYVAQDDKGNYGQTIPFSQGETRIVSVYLLRPSGLPYIIPGTLAEIFLKIFSQINSSSITKSMSGALVTPITIAGPVAGCIGFQFKLTVTDTAAMAANNSGLPMTAKFTDSNGNVLEVDFASIFNVSVPVVST